MMKPTTDADTVPKPGEIRRGNTMIVPAAHVRLNPITEDGANAFYLLEVYTKSESEMDGTMAAAVIDSTGKALVQTSPTPIRLAGGGGVVKGHLDLTGLPEGTYQMQVKVAVNGKTVERSAPFTMIGLEEAAARAPQVATAAGGGDARSDEAYFAELGEEQLDSLFAPLNYIASGRDLRPWDKKMTVQAKRNFLAQFWKQRDPTAGTDRNEMRESFYDAIDFANRQYGESTRAGKPGWKTDRGRIYAKYGVADEALDRPREGRSPPFQVWRYNRNKGRFYIFADRTGLGNYQLIFTNDRNESNIATWSDVLGETGMQQAGRFLGVDLFQLAGMSSDRSFE
jgi:GWxTD domain-containing protein